MRRIGLACAVAGCASAVVGCGGGGRGGGSSSASLSALIPATVFTSRSYEVEVLGSGTAWTAAAAPTVDLGAGVAVDQVLVASPTALVLDVTVGDDAPPGPRSVTVGGLAFAGFEVAAPMSMEQVEATVDQGTIHFPLLRCLDAETPFLANGAQLFLDGGDAWGVSVGATPSTVDAALVVPPDAAPGLNDLRLNGSATPLLRSRFVIHDAFTVRARAPVTSFPASGALVGTETALLRYDAGPVPALVQFPFAETGFATLLYMPGQFGLAFEAHASDPGGPKSITVPGEADWLLVYTSDGSPATYAFGAPVVTPAPTVDEAEPNDTPAAAQTMPVPGIVLAGMFTSTVERDVYKFAAAAGDVGRVVHVITSGVVRSSLFVRVLRPDGTTVLSTSLSTPPGSQVDFTTAPIPVAGTYFVEVSDPNGDIGPFGDAYRLFLELE